MPERARAQDSRLAKTCHGDLQKGSEDWKEVLPGVRAGVYFIDSGEFAEDSGDGEMIFSRLIAKVLENESRRQKNCVSPEQRHATWLRNLQKNRNRSLALSKKRRKEQE